MQPSPLSRLKKAFSSLSSQTFSRPHFSTAVGENLWGYFFIMPQMVGFLTFAVLPVLTELGERTPFEFSVREQDADALVLDLAG